MNDPFPRICPMSARLNGIQLFLKSPYVSNRKGILICNFPSFFNIQMYACSIGNTNPVLLIISFRRKRMLISSFRQGHLVLLQRVRAGTSTKGVGGNVGQKIWPVFVIVNSVN